MIEVIKRVAAIFMLLLLIPIQLIIKIIIILLKKVNVKTNLILKNLRKILKVNQKIKSDKNNIGLRITNV